MVVRIFRTAATGIFGSWEGASRAMTREPGDRPARVALAQVQGMAQARNLRLSDDYAVGAASVRVTGACASARQCDPTARAEAPASVAKTPGVMK